MRAFMDSFRAASYKSWEDFRTFFVEHKTSNGTLVVINIMETGSVLLLGYQFAFYANIMATIFII